MKDAADGRNKLPFKRADVILIVCSLAAAAVLFVMGIVFTAGGQTQLSVHAYLDGELRIDRALSDDERTVITAADGGENTVVIHDNCVYVESADCPGQDCVKMGRISKAGEEIVCLPHRLVIRIVGGEAGIDAMVR